MTTFGSPLRLYATTDDTDWRVAGELGPNEKALVLEYERPWVKILLGTGVVGYAHETEFYEVVLHHDEVSP